MCDKCNYKCCTASRLRDHIRKKHEKTEKTCICDICGNFYATKLSLKIHHDVVHSKIKHVCDICGEEFKSKHTLRDVTILHKSIICSILGSL